MVVVYMEAMEAGCHREATENTILFAVHGGM